MSTELTITYDVLPEHSAASVGSGLLNVLSTPALLSFMENTALQLMASHVGDDESQVGIEVELKHLAATALGNSVSITAKLIDQKGSIISFEIDAYEDDKLIGQAQHKRAIVNKEKFMQNLK